MERYRNVSGNSGVSAFEIGSDYIIVTFKGSSKQYRYSYERAKKVHVDNMKILAQSGSGLNAYINQNVNDLYDK